MAPVKRVAVIGAGPAGAIAVDALAQEKAFDVIRVFERREKAGGCWIQDPADTIPQLTDINALANKDSADAPIKAPSELPYYTERSKQNRHAETSVYPLLETNIDSKVMEFSQEKIPESKSSLSITRHGNETPFRHHTTVQAYIEDLLKRNGYENFVQYNTTVENVEKPNEDVPWKVTLRKELPGGRDYWWFEEFDSVVVASGHYTVPFIPKIEGLAEFAKTYPGAVEHSKGYRGPEKYRGKQVVVVGASVSGMDIAVDLLDHAAAPVTAVVRGRWHPYFGGSAFDHPLIQKRPEINRIDSSKGARTIHFSDGTSIHNVDNIILGTGYQWTLPFLPKVEIRNNRVPNLYLHVFYRHDPTLIFIGAVAAGLTFKVYEWQSVLAARFLAGKAKLPEIEEQVKWEEDRIKYKGDGVPFTALFPDFEDYFERVRSLAGEPKEGRGRVLPVWDKSWEDAFFKGHEMRKNMWKKSNERARRKSENGNVVRAKL